MIAQKSIALIDAIDLDEASIQEAVQNFQNSPWTNRINAIKIDAKEFAVSAMFRYDYILSNPPFFDNSLK